MAINDIWRRLRGAIGNAVVWGVGWAVGGLGVLVTLKLTGVIGTDWEHVFIYAARAGIVGGATGGAFSAFIGLLYRGRRLSDINWVRFALGGGVVTGLFVPLFLQTMNLLSGDGLVPWELVLDDALWTSLFGATVAGGSVRLAQLAEKSASDSHDRINDGGPDGLVSAGDRES